MNRENYLYNLSEYFVNSKLSDFDETTINQVGRTILDHLGVASFAAKYKCGAQAIDFLLSIAPEGNVSVWGREQKTTAMFAAFINGTQTSNIELDDCSAIGASVHPSVYILSTALALFEEENASETDLVRSIVFGYDICLRMGLLATEKVRDLGLHGPALVGGMASAAVASILLKLNVEQTVNALSIVSTLLPMCPFSSFMEGAGVKEMYGGYGNFVGIMAAKAAKSGLTGPKHVIEGAKSSQCIFGGTGGLDVKAGEQFFINCISFKEFSACHGVHPAMTAVSNLLERVPLDYKEIKNVDVLTYAFSYALHCGVHEPLNSSSARLSLDFTVAVAIIEKELSPRAFFDEGLANEEYLSLKKKIKVKKNDDYGDGPFSIRGTKIIVTMNDGTIYEEEVSACRWDKQPSTDDLLKKFDVLTADVFDKQDREKLMNFALDEGERKQETLITLMNKIR